MGSLATRVRDCIPPVPLLQFYSAFTIFCLGDRGWTFVNAFFFELLGGMRLVGIDQFAESFASMVLSTWVGNWLDRHNRRTGALTMLATNTLSMAASAALLGLCIILNGAEGFLRVVFLLSLVLSIVLSSVTKCASDGKRIVFTRDWVVVLANRFKGNNSVSAVLSKNNSAMVTIDQLASVLGPLITGFLLSWFGHKFLCAVIIVWNLFALATIRLFMVRVYGQVPELGTRSENEEEQAKNGVAQSPKDQQQTILDGSPADLPASAPPARRSLLITQLSAYYRQSVFPAAFGLALLYLTVLGFDGFAVGFGRAQGMSEDGIGVYRGISSMFGLFGAITFWPAEHRVGLRRSGLIGLTLQHLCLWLCVVSIWLPGSPFDPVGYAKQWTLSGWLKSSRSAFDHDSSIKNGTSNAFPKHPELASINVFFIGLTLSRFGLWMADLAIIQLMQLSVPERDRGTVFGVQNGVSMLFSMCKDLLVVLLPDPRTFGLLIILSLLCVGIGFLQYIHFLIKTRNSNLQDSMEMSMKGRKISPKVFRKEEREEDEGMQEIPLEEPEKR